MARFFGLGPFGGRLWGSRIWTRSPLGRLGHWLGGSARSATEITVVCPERGGEKIKESECKECEKFGYWRAGAEALCWYTAEEMAEQEAERNRGGEEFEKFLKLHGGGSKELKEKDECKDEGTEEGKVENDEGDNPTENEKVSDWKLMEERRRCRKTGGLFVSREHKNDLSDQEDGNSEETDDLDDENDNKDDVNDEMDDEEFM